MFSIQWNRAMKCWFSTLEKKAALKTVTISKFSIWVEIDNFLEILWCKSMTVSENGICIFKSIHFPSVCVIHFKLKISYINIRCTFVFSNFSIFHHCSPWKDAEKSTNESTYRHRFLSPNAFFGHVSQGITNSNLQSQKFVLSETTLCETALAEGCLYINFALIF